MARIPREVVEAIRDRVDIIEVVSRHVQLQRRGNSWVGLCPFHQEKTPSFHVIPTKAMFHCFGCQASGDAFRFLMEVEGLGFVEAVKELAGPAGVTVEERALSPSERAALKARATLYDVLEAAAAFFEHQLWTSSDGAEARAYLERRRIPDALAREARLGWAPAGWTRLIDHLHQEGFAPAMLRDAGLAKARERGDGQYDTFRERVIIPIRDERTRVIAFGGRLLEGDGPKYINSPETRLYQKSSVLYGLDAARRAVGRRERLILVEGYFDVLAMQHAGFHETVATCGTSLTPEHVQRIRRLTREVVVLLDADEAGARAAERTLPMFAEAGIQAWRLQLPGAKDPDDLIREEGPEAMEAALTQRTSLLSWVAERKIRGYGYSAAGKERAREELADLLGGLGPEQVSEISPILRLPEREFLEWARAYRPRSLGPGPEHELDGRFDDAGPPAWTPHRDVVHLLWLLVHRYDQVADLLMDVPPTLLDAHAPVKPAFARLVQGESVATVVDEEPDPWVRKALVKVVSRASLYGPDEAAAATVHVLGRIAEPLYERRLARAKRRAMDRNADADRRRTALSQLQRLKHALYALRDARSTHQLAETVDVIRQVETPVDEE